MKNFVSTDFVHFNEIPAICRKLQPESVEQFWLEKLVNGRLINGRWDTNVGKEALYQDYYEFCNIHDLNKSAFATFDKQIFGQMLLDRSLSDKDYRPSTKKNDKTEELSEQIEHCVPSLERSRRLYLESRPDLVSHITRERFAPEVAKRKRRIRFDYTMFFLATVILIYQIYLYGTQGAWTSYSLFHFMEMANWQTGLNWFADNNDLSTAKQLGQKILDYSELGLVLLTVGVLVNFNTDYD